MSHKQENHESRSAWEPPAPSPSSGARNLMLVGGVVGVVCIAAAFWRFTVKQAVVVPTPAVQSETAEEPVAVEFEKLKGQWLRPDGGYVLELKQLLPSNELEAAYFNPDPIHVAKARLYKERGFVKIFVELRDVNYPGSTYTLIYDAENDLLRGLYYQALEQQTFDIAFERMTPGS